MKKHKRMLSLLCAIVMVVTLMAPTALALQGPEEGVPALPVENPVHNGGFWVSLYAKNAEGTAYEDI